MLLLSGVAGLAVGFFVISFSPDSWRLILTPLGLVVLPYCIYEIIMFQVRGRDMAEVGAFLGAIEYGLPAGLGWIVGAGFAMRRSY